MVRKTLTPDEEAVIIRAEKEHLAGKTISFADFDLIRQFGGSLKDLKNGCFKRRD